MSTTPDPNNQSAAQPSNGAADDVYTGLPKWVKWTLLAILAVIVALVLVRLVGGGNHGPSRHGMAPVGPSAPVAATAGLLDR